MPICDAHGYQYTTSTWQDSMAITFFCLVLQMYEIYFFECSTIGAANVFLFVEKNSSKNLLLFRIIKMKWFERHNTHL